MKPLQSNLECYDFFFQYFTTGNENENLGFFLKFETLLGVIGLAVRNIRVSVIARCSQHWS